MLVSVRSFEHTGSHQNIEDAYMLKHDCINLNWKNCNSWINGFTHHGVVIRILPNGQISDTRSIVVAISESSSSFNFSLTASIAIRISKNLKFHSKISTILLTQSSRKFGGLCSFCFHPLQQTIWCQFSDEITRNNVAFCYFTLPFPLNIDNICNGWRYFYMHRDVNWSWRPTRFNTRLVCCDWILKNKIGNKIRNRNNCQC